MNQKIKGRPPAQNDGRFDLRLMPMHKAALLEVAWEEHVALGTLIAALLPKSKAAIRRAYRTASE